MDDVVFEHKGHTHASQVVGQRGDSLEVRGWRRPKANLAHLAVGQLVTETNGIHALGYGENEVLPSIAGGDALLARNAVQQGEQAGLRTHKRGGQIDGVVENSGLYGKVPPPSFWAPRGRAQPPHAFVRGPLRVNFAPATPTSARNPDPTRAPHVKEIVRTAPFSAARRIELASNRVGSAI